jgi:ATP synthase protein I
MAKKFKFPLKFISQESSAFLVATHIVGGVLAGLLVGYVVDSLFNTSPWGLLIFFILGIIAGFKNAYQEMNRLVEKENNTLTKSKQE